MSEETTRAYSGNGITVTFDSEVCTHSAHCVRELPNVFDVDQRPWINVNAAPALRIAEQVDRCPSGALQYHWPE